jgi:hypothetical protein
MDRSPVFLFVFSQRLGVSAVNLVVRQLPGTMNADAGRRGSSVVNILLVAALPRCVHLWPNLFF